MKSEMPKHVHVIGICGVATSALAIAFHKNGAKVTGSDKGFFPPVSMELEKQGVAYYAGWHPEKMTEGGNPDLIVVGTASGSQNPETAFAKENNIPMYSFAEAIGKYFVKEKSVVCTGTWGKTSSSAMLSHICKEAGIDPTYMFGGVSLSHESSAKLTKSDISIFEGDEYKSSPTDNTAKFFYYKPTHLMLSAVSWDHADLYPTPEDYFNAFRKLCGQLPKSGVIVACKDNEGVKKTLNDAKVVCPVISYGKSSDFNFSYSNVIESTKGITFEITEKSMITSGIQNTQNAEKSYKINAQLLGAFQAENITGCFAMARQLGLTADQIIAGIASFKGLKRRLEKRIDGSGTKSRITVLDDIAHSPEKAISVLKTLRNVYKGKIITIFEPNIGGRSRESVAKYDNSFQNSDIVIIPRLTKLKIKEGDEQPMEGDELASVISKTHKNTIHIEDDAKLVEYLISNTKKDDVIAFLGSHGFRSMIEEVVEKLK